MYDTNLTQLFAYHGQMLRDSVRVQAYRQAISSVIHPGDVVIDLGSGTGILALFACQAGARKVYAIERGRIAKLAERLAIDNGYRDRIEIVNRESTAATLPEPADVLVTEILWNFGLGEGLLDAVADARGRLLAPEARLIPSRLELFAAPAELPSVFERLDIWNDERLGVNLAAARRTVLSSLCPVDAGIDSLLAPAARITQIDLTGSIDEHGTIGSEARFSIQRSGVLHGLVGWFRAELTPSIHLTNAPPNPCSSWKQALLAVDPPLVVAAGDLLVTRIDAVGDGSVWRWEVQHSRGGAILAQRKHSTLEAFTRFGLGALPSLRHCQC
jgi:precorrin-6B methylase 2